MSVKLVTRRAPTLVIEEFEEQQGHRRFRAHLRGRAHLSGHGKTAPAAISDLQLVLEDLFHAVQAGSEAFRTLPRIRPGR